MGTALYFFDNKEMSFWKNESNLKPTNVVGRDVQHKSIETSDPHLDSKSFHRKSPIMAVLKTFKTHLSLKPSMDPECSSLYLRAWS